MFSTKAKFVAGKVETAMQNLGAGPTGSFPVNLKLAKNGKPQGFVKKASISSFQTTLDRNCPRIQSSNIV